eukprot:scaffold3716_cov69-Cylindrotheca_fusiformis.AAC.13
MNRNRNNYLRSTVVFLMRPSLLLLLLLLLRRDSFCHGFLVPQTTKTTTTTTTSTSRRMFTGIVEEMGSVVSLSERDDMPLWDGSKGSGTELVVQAGDVVMEGAYLG